MTRLKYENLPVFLQNTLCSAYGLRQRHQMYSGDFSFHLNRMMVNQFRPTDELRMEQLESLRGIVGRAVKHVPFYRNRHHEYSAEGLATWSNFSKLPILEKESVRASPMSFINPEVLRRERIIVGKTSGTTGTPLEVKITYSAFRQLWAAMERLRTWGQVSRFDRRISFTGKVFVPLKQESTGPFWRYDLFGKRMLLSVYHLNESNLPLYIKAIHAFSPKFIDGYPSAIGRLAQFCLDHSYSIDSLVAAFPTAETLTPAIRSTIESGLDVKVLNQYGSTEVASHIGECEHGNLHVSPEIGIIELLDLNGNKVSPGEVGYIVMTGLVNEAMPLIRYRIGDMAIAVDPNQTCECGRSLPLIGSVLGRDDDLVVTRDGCLLPIMNYHVFKVAKGVKEAQLIQNKVDEFVLVVIPDPSEKLDLNDSINELNNRLGYATKVKIEIRSELQHSSAGKIRGVVSKLH